MFPMHILESDSIESLKLRIQSYKGFVVKNQKLVFGGRELSRSNSLVREYGVSNGDVLHLVLRLSELQIINVKTTSGKEYTFNVERGRDVAYVKQKIAAKDRGFYDIYEHEVVCGGEQLQDQRLINDICRYCNDAVLHLFVRNTAKVQATPVEKNFELSIVASPLEDGEPATREYDAQGDRFHKVVKESLPRDFLLEPIIVSSKIKLPSVISNMISDTFDGLNVGNGPIRAMEGTGGAYFMQDVSGHKFVSLFKPIDEEPMAANNPQGLPLSSDGEGLKKGTRVGEGAFREAAAYALDHPKNGRRLMSNKEQQGFAGVPPTTIVKCLHKGFNHSTDVSIKLGSLQLFMENYGSCEDIGPGAFPVKEVHKISVLDIRMANADRHAGNILLSKDTKDGRTILIPIDHGYCLPESFEDCTFDWLNWPQSHQPYDLETVDYIRSLDAEEDIELLKYFGWEMPVRCARTLRISTMLLKKGVEKGLTPFDIGSIMCREDLNEESTIEEIVLEAEDVVLPGTSEADFLDVISIIMDHRLDEIARSLS